MKDIKIKLAELCHVKLNLGFFTTEIKEETYLSFFSPRLVLGVDGRYYLYRPCAGKEVFWARITPKKAENIKPAGKIYHQLVGKKSISWRDGKKLVQCIGGF